MSAREKLRRMLNESFVPFAFILISLFLFLLYIDNIIRAKSNLPVIINVQQETDETGSDAEIAVDIDDAAFPDLDMSAISLVKAAMKSGNYKGALQNFAKINPVYYSRQSLGIPLAYCYLKTGDERRSLAVLNGIRNKSGKIDFYYGLAFSRLKLFERARARYLSFVASHGDSFEGQYNLGIVYFRLKDYANSLKHAKRAIGISSGKRRAAAYYLAAASEHESGSGTRALSLLDDSIKLDPLSLKARYLRSKILIEKKPKEGVREFEKLLKIDANFEDAYYQLGKYYFEHGKSARAIDILSKGVRFTSRSGALRSYLGFIYLEQEDFSNASTIYEGLTVEFPGKDLYQFNLARSYSGLDDYPAAARAYTKALAINGKYYKALLNLGVVYSKMERYREAINYYEQARELHPESGLIYYNLGVLHRRMKSYKPALDNFFKAISLQENYPEAYFNIGLVYSRLDRFGDAVRNYNKAIEQDEKYELPYINLSILYKKAGRLEEMEDIIKRGIRNSGSIALKNRLASHYYSTGNLTGALAAYKSILKLQADDADALLGAAQTNSALRNFEDSEKYILRYISLYPTGPEGRYIYMIDLFMQGRLKDAQRQYEILETVQPGYKDISIYRDKLAQDGT